MKTLTVKIIGSNPLIQANAQTVDRFNKYAKEMKKINAKKTKRTDEDYERLADLEVRSKIHWNDEVGVIVPPNWLMESICKHSFAIAKISKANIRGGVFITNNVIPLQYAKKTRVKTPEDIVKDGYFRYSRILPQGQVRICKTMPIFHDWSFECTIDFDPAILDPDELQRVIEHGARYGGFGDFRPTFGRATAEINHHG